LFPKNLPYDNDVMPFDGESTSLLRLAVNGKIIEINVDEVKSPVFRNFMNLFKQYGDQRLELVFSKVSCKRPSLSDICLWVT